MVTHASSRAVESLLDDSDERTRQVVFDELLNDYEKHRELIQQLSRSRSARVRKAVRHLRNLNRSGQHQCLAHCPEDWLDSSDWHCLETFCWQMSRQRDPEFKPASGIKFLDRLAYQVNEKVLEYSGESPVAIARIQAFQSVLHRRYGFGGNHQNYYHPDNSYLSRVLESRKGIPLSLSLIVIFIGQRLDWEVMGLNFPGHFMAGLGNTAFDPFHDGVIVTPEQLAERFLLPVTEFEDLSAYQASPLMVAQRWLGNLLIAYQHCGDREACSRIEAYWQAMRDAA